MNKKYTKNISTSNPVQCLQHIKTKNTITLLLNISLFTEQLFSCFHNYNVDTAVIRRR